MEKIAFRRLNRTPFSSEASYLLMRWLGVWQKTAFSLNEKNSFPFIFPMFPQAFSGPLLGRQLLFIQFLMSNLGVLEDTQFLLDDQEGIYPGLVVAPIMCSWNCHSCSFHHLWVDGYTTLQIGLPLNSTQKLQIVLGTWTCILIGIIQ